MTGGERSVEVMEGAPDALAPSPERESRRAEAQSPRAGTLDPADILSSIGEVPYDWDIGTDALVWSANAGEILMTDPDAIATGRSFARLLEPDNLITRFDAITQSSHQDEGQGVPYQLEYSLQPKPGARLWVEDMGRWFAGADGRPARAHGVVRVINERHEHEERLAYLSRFDDLTGEMNRWRLTEVLATILDEAVKCRSACAFLLLAVDNLTRINEAYGYTVADEVIGAVAKRLRAKLRTGDTLGRFSGNKFGVVLRNCTPDEMAVAAERLLSGVRDDVMRTAAGPIAVTMSAGGVVAPRHARDVQETLERAQDALSTARAKRPGSFLAYRPSVEREALRRENVRATDEIVAALNDRRILLAFEPIVEIVARQPAFYESLMRIRRADGTLVAASAVIPIAERLGLVRLLDHRVLELAIAELIASPTLKLSLNVSPASTGDPDWWASLAAHLRAHSGVAERVIVEITEMAEIRDVDETRGFVTRTKDLGCRIAIDDFGAGYTSFRNLRKLGVDIIKIDGAFVQNLPRSADDRVFVRTMLDLARPLGLSTVAEWVQDEESAAMLRDWGCDYLQGALVGRASIERPWTTAPPAVEAPAATA
jgi:diguanylate cyclase (GGDEF)-like protein